MDKDKTIDSLIEALEVAIKALTRLGEENTANVFIMKITIENAKKAKEAK